MAFDQEGSLWVSQTEKGKITKISIKNGIAEQSKTVYSGLNNPHGLVFDSSGMLFMAEEDKISTAGPNGLEKVIDLPKGGRHFTRTLGFGPDGRLYVSIGSSCDVCREQDERYAAIYSMNEDGSDFKQVASGLRNSVFFTWSFVDGKMWATEMSRDYLGDDLPPDEINIINPAMGQNPVPDFGWPVCYSQNINDRDFDKNVYIQNPCNGKIPPKVEIPAHSATLGLAFIPEEGWPEQYWYSLLVSLHGSWNRSEPTGYKIVRVKLDSKGNYLGMEDFISGWLSKDGITTLGRPVDIKTMPGGIMYISDDKAGVIYKVAYTGNQ